MTHINYGHLTVEENAGNITDLSDLGSGCCDKVANFSGLSWGTSSAWKGKNKNSSLQYQNSMPDMIIYIYNFL